MSAKLSWVGGPVFGPLSFVAFAVLLFILTVIAFILGACEAVWCWICGLVGRRPTEPDAPTSGPTPTQETPDAAR